MMKIWVTIAIIASLVVVILAGCGSGGSSGSTLTGTVVNGATDVPLSGVRVALGNSNTTTNASGAFTLTGLSTGAGVLTAQIAGYEISSVQVDITIGKNTLDEPVKMAASSGNPPVTTPRTIEGTITLAGGSNPTGVKVTLLSGNTQYDQMTTGSDGKYFFWAPAGTYNVRAEKTGFVTKSQAVQVTDMTKVVTLNITLAAQ
jgi:hypothetical protein